MEVHQGNKAPLRQDDAKTKKKKFKHKLSNQFSDEIKFRSIIQLNQLQATVCKTTNCDEHP